MFHGGWPDFHWWPQPSRRHALFVSGWWRRRELRQLDLVSFCIGGMMTVFFFARYWRRAEIPYRRGLTEIRYSGKPARIS